jgi:hypothetical protein
VSSLTLADLSAVSTLVDFLKGPGYVLDFSDRTFSQFFGSEFNIDIDDLRYSDMGSSKGKRLRRFLQLTDDATAARVLSSLWEYRLALIDGGKDPVANAKGRFSAVLSKVEKHGPKPAATASANPILRDRLKSELIALSSMAPHPEDQRSNGF